MESQSIVAEILSQLKELTEDVTSMSQDVDALKHVSLLQHDNMDGSGTGAVDNMTGEPVPYSTQSSISNSGLMTYGDSDMG